MPCLVYDPNEVTKALENNTMEVHYHGWHNYSLPETGLLGRLELILVPQQQHSETVAVLGRGLAHENLQISHLENMLNIDYHQLLVVTHMYVPGNP